MSDQLDELVEINVFPPGTYSKLVYQKDAVQKKLLMSFNYKIGKLKL